MNVHIASAVGDVIVLIMVFILSAFGIAVSLACCLAIDAIAAALVRRSRRKRRAAGL